MRQSAGCNGKCHEIRGNQFLLEESQLLVWLASYPRSGNTYIRMLLKDVFGLGSWSLHGEGDERVFGSRSGLRDIVRHLNTSKTADELISEAQNSKEIYIIKTHERPLTDDPAIYVVRDGRASIISYFHYLNEIENFMIPLEQVIDGDVFAGSWSGHFKNWDPQFRKSTLLLRYEVISNNPRLLVKELGAFLELLPVKAFTRSFSELNAVFPEFFRAGNNKLNISEMEPFTAHFINKHGNLMRNLGYSDWE